MTNLYSPINKKQKVIFLHLPKCGGTTLHSILENNFDSQEIFTIQVIDNIKLNTEDFINMPQEKRNRFILLKGHMLFGLHQYFTDEAKYITFLRNPVDRIISYYYYVLRRPNHRLYNEIINNNYNIYDFTKKINQGDVNNAQIRMISGINDTEQNMYEKAVENIENHFSFVGLQEKFDQSLLLLQKIYNFNNILYTIKNKTTNRKKVTDIDKKTYDLIKELNNGDYLLYGYIQSKFEQTLTEHNIQNFHVKLFQVKNHFSQKKYLKRAKNKIVGITGIKRFLN